MLSFELFSNMYNAWKKSYEENRMFENALSPFFDATIISTFGMDTRNAFEQLINVSCELPLNSNLLYWWTVDECAHEKFEENNKVYKLDTLKDLYNYILDGNEKYDEEDVEYFFNNDKHRVD